MTRRKFTLSAERLEDRLTPAGALDPTFNPTGSTPGYQTVDFGSVDTARATVVQPDGKIIAVGSTDNGTPDFAITRLNPDGSLDNNFGSVIVGGGSGKVNVYFGTNSGSGSEFANAVYLQPDGKIIVAGYSNIGHGAATSTTFNTFNDFAVCRLNADGTLDTSFNGTGKLTIDFANEGDDDRVTALGLQSDNKIIVAGSWDGGTSDFAILRLNTNGTLDTSFAPGSGITAGEQHVFFGSNVATGSEFATSLVVQPDNRIVVAGYSNLDHGAATSTTFNDFAVCRLNVNGTLDTTFNGTGKQTINFGGIFATDDRANAVALQAGKIVLAGSSDAGESDFVITRLNTDGTLDTSFALGSTLGGGRQDVYFGSSSASGKEYATGVKIGPDNKIVVGGYTNLDSLLFSRYAVARLNADGTLDTNFDTDGKQDIAPQFNATAYGLDVMPDGRIVVAGIDGGNFAIARIEGDRVSLSVTMDDQETTVHSGEQLTYTLTIANGGPDDALGTHVSAFTQGGSFFGAHWSYERDNGPTVQNLPNETINVPLGGVVNYTIHVIVPDAASGSTHLVGLATTPAGEFDRNLANNSATDTDAVEPDADLTATITDGATTVAAGGQVTYTMVVSNAGPDDVTGAKVSGSFTPALTNVTYTSTAAGGATGNTASGSGFPADTLSVPAFGGLVTYTIHGTLPAAATGTQKASVTVSVPDGVFDPNTGNNTATDTDTITTTTTTSVRPLAVSGRPDGSALVYAPGMGGQYANSPAATFHPFGAAVPVRVAVGDLLGDGGQEIVMVTGPGTPIRFAVVSSVNGSVVIPPTAPFAGSEDFTGGGFVSVANLDDQGGAEIIITPDLSGGPRVTVFSLAPVVGQNNSFIFTPTVRANFFGIDDPNFRGGARTAAGDVNGDGTPDLVVVAGFGGGPRAAIFDGRTVFAGPTRLVGDFFAFPGSDATTLRNGVFVAAGDINGDGKADLIFGGGPGGAPRVFILNGALVSAGNVAGAQAAPVANFFVAGNSADRGGVRVTATDADGDTRADLAVGSGEGSPSRVRTYLGKNFTTAAEPGTFQDLDPFGAVLPGGVFVG
jgi:uncharacterized delta-60 repeat protein/uncharacterized repeat protein (TIGR01451 family)